MTKPKQARAAPAAVATDTAATAIMAQLKAYQEEVAAPVNPFAGAAKVNPFAGSANPFASVRNAASAFATKSTNAFAAVASKATEAFGPKGGTALRSRALDAFRPQQGRGGKLPQRRFLVPPPPSGPPQFGRFWMPMCELLSLYEDPWQYRDQLWSRGDGWDFTVAAQRAGEECFERNEGWEEGHEPDDDGVCWHPEHALSPLEAESFEQTLRCCDHEEWEWGAEWAEIVPLMVEIRELALEQVDKYINVPAWLDMMYRWAGWTVNDLVPIMRDLQTPILEAVESGVHDEGLAAAYADCMARHFPRAFGTIGNEVDEVLTQIHTEGSLMDGPDHHLIFEAIREPREIWTSCNGREWIQLAGRYGVTRATYHSALARSDITTEGYVGWRALWMTPVESWSEIHEQDGVVVWSDDDAESNKGY